jgi:two-component system C4-dicarboxylate transport sensor histidine kinase DctB
MVKAQVDWSAKTAGYGDAFNLAVLYFLVMLISWLSTKEIERSLGRARRSEAALKKERDLLEIKVEERTRDLEKSQLEKISQLYRFAEYGKLTSGILHDLANPLSAISLNLEKMQGTEQSTLLKRALEGTKRMERFVELARKQIQNQKDLSVFSVAKEIQQSIKGLEYKAKLENVKLQFSKPNDITLYGSPMRFHQLISNLIGNAIDAYDHYETDHERVVIISYEFTGSKIYLRILDFGKGVSQEDNEKIFEPFFTTKTTDKGTGMGLSICKDIVEKDFHGKLQLISEKGKGTLFLVEIPIHHEPS